MRKQGFSREKIRKDLEEHGWNEKIINHFLDRSEKK